MPRLPINPSGKLSTLFRMTRKSPTPSLRTCQHCGSEFPGNTNGRYCTPVCKRQANYQSGKVKAFIESRLVDPRQCHLCSTEFLPSKNTQIYCTSKCSSHAATRRYRANKPDQALETQRKWAEVNRERVREYSRSYATTHREAETARMRQRRHTDPSFRVAMSLRGRIRSAVIAQGTIKAAKLWDILGCDKQYLISHLESQFTEGMSWENYGQWHIDHIKPCANFDLTDHGQQKVCFHYSNLQPLWAEENFSKGAKYTQIAS